MREDNAILCIILMLSFGIYIFYLILKTAKSDSRKTYRRTVSTRKYPQKKEPSDLSKNIALSAIMFSFISIPSNRIKKSIDVKNIKELTYFFLHLVRLKLTVIDKLDSKLTDNAIHFLLKHFNKENNTNLSINEFSFRDEFYYTIRKEPDTYLEQVTNILIISQYEDIQDFDTITLSMLYLKAIEQYGISITTTFLYSKALEDAVLYFNTYIKDEPVNIYF